MGVNIEANEDQLLIKSGEKLTSANIKTLVYPGFPTDLQQPLTALLTKAEGTSVITDTIYSARVKHIDELRRMNAKIKVEGGSIVIDGPVQLEGARVKASDLRARSEEHTSELQSRGHLVCRLLLEKKKNKNVVHQ